MATTNLSNYDTNTVPDASGMRFCIIVSEWNKEITFALRDGTVKALMEHGVNEQDIEVIYVPGSFELVYAAARIANESMLFNAVIVLGSVVRGGTPHFEYVCQGVTQGIAQLNSQGYIPVIFGLLTTDDMQQALDRAGGKHGNKGVEAGITAIKMVALNRKIDQNLISE